MSTEPQGFASHRRWVPLYHFVALPILFAYFVYTVVGAIRDPSVATIYLSLAAFAIATVGFYARGFALKVQDRVICLEERFRMERVLPDDLKARSGEFSTRQLVGLRFASDGELPALARKVLDEKIERSDDIKKQVKEWRPDHRRA